MRKQPWYVTSRCMLELAVPFGARRDLIRTVPTTIDPLTKQLTVILLLTEGNLSLYGSISTSRLYVHVAEAVGGGGGEDE